MLCPSCSTSYLDPYGRCPACGFVGAPPMASGPLTVGQPPKAPGGLSIAAQILLAVEAFASIGGVIGAAMILASLAANGDRGNAGTFVSGFSTVLSLPVYLATVVVFIIWFHKVRTNIEVIAPQHRSYGRGWAIGGWFVPIGWFWIPRVVAGDVWTASRPLGSDPRRTSTRSALLNSWWILWCAMWVAAVVSAIQSGSANVNGPGTVSVSSLETSAVLGIVVGVLRAAAALLALFVVRKITTLQQVRILQGPGEGHPYAAPALPYPQGYPQPYPQAYPQPYPQVQYQQQPYPPAQYPYPAPQPYQPAPAAPPVPAPVGPAQPPAVELAKTVDAPAATPPVATGPEPAATEAGTPGEPTG